LALYKQASAGLGGQLRGGSTGVPWVRGHSGQEGCSRAGEMLCPCVWGKDASSGESFPCGPSFCLPLFSETMPGGPRDDKQARNGGLAMSGLEVSSLS